MENTGNVLNKLRLQNEECDVTIQIGERSFPAHRLVLVAKMQYFKTMFTIDMREKHESLITLNPEIIDPELFEDILSYIYTSRIKITKQNVKSICIAAQFFLEDDLLDKAVNFLRINVDDKDIFEIISYWNFAVMNDFKSLKKKFQTIIASKQISKIIKEQFIPFLTIEDLKSFLEKLNALFRHESMFYYIIEWIQSNQDERIDHLLPLFESIPLKSLGFDFLKNIVSKEKLILKNLELKN